MAKNEHPARFSPEIVARIREILLERHPFDEIWNRPILHDPFAGTGERLAEIARTDDVGFSYSGTECELEFIHEDHLGKIVWGDATIGRTYPSPARPWIIVTSPVYPNGMADHWKAKDGSIRKTYFAAKRKLSGDPDAELHHNNMGRFGYRGTKRGGRSRKRDGYWRVAREASAHWGCADYLIVNVSDFLHSNGAVEPLVADWIELLTEERGWVLGQAIEVETQRMGLGENRNERAPTETILVFERAG